jgi:error-prone DNA polymerase
MPEYPVPKLRPAPEPPTDAAPVEPAPPYAELDVATNFSFLRGASHPDELIYRAAELGYRAIAVTDYNTLAGVVRAHGAANKVGLKLLIGARLVLTDAPDLLVWAPDRPAYASLCRLLTLGKRRTEKGECELHLADVLDHADSGLLAALIPPPVIDDAAVRTLRLLRSAIPDDDRLSLATSCLYNGDDRSRLRALAELAQGLKVPLLATNGVHYHDPGRRVLQDVLTCIRHGCSIPEAGYRLFPNGERYLKPPAVMHHLFAEHPQAIRRGIDIAERCTFALDELRYEYPHELAPAGRTPLEHLADLTWAGAATRYPGGIPEDVRTRLEHELKLIAQLRYEAYFLTVHDLVRFARSRGILCQGRGSAANSAVCYCLGVTSVDPARIDLLFERFISAARNEPPDIDVDFEHERREEVIQYVYEKYDRERSGMTAEVITYRGRSAVRDVGKALGLGLDLVDQMAKRLDWWDRGTVSRQDLTALGLDPDDRTVRTVVALSHELLGFPRHLSQHVGGMVMTRGPLCELVPIENASMPDRTVIEWDKDDIDAVGILKVDVLALGMLTCISKAFAMLNKRNLTTENTENAENAATKIFESSSSLSVSSVSSVVHSSPKLELHTVPPEDPAVYEMICNADTIGVFQIESRAQMSMLPRLRPEKFYDLVIEVAIVRPGPIQGNMVHPYLKRRSGLEPVTYPSKELEQVLGKTLGVPLFQEQAMRVAMVGAGFSAEEADQLRRAMAAWRRSGEIERFHQKILEGMTANGYAREFAEQCFNQIKGFGEYGFPESHAASFALLVYVSAWLKRHHPAAFAAALLNSQPMGFYAPAQIVRDAREHGVAVLPVDVNASDWDCALEDSRSPFSLLACEQRPDAQLAVGSPETGPASPPRPDAPLAGEAPGHCSQASRLNDQVPNHSATWGANGPRLRLGLRQIRGLARAHADRVVEARARCGRFASVPDFRRATSLPRHAIERLAQADAFSSLGLSRRQALWLALAIKDDDAPLFEEIDDSAREPAVALPMMPPGQEVMADYATTSMSLKRHPLSLVRSILARERITTAAELPYVPHGRWVKVAGLVLIRQRPGTASGIVFVTLEDETGIANLIVRPDLYDRQRAAARHAMLLQADGYLEREGQVIHIMAKRLTDRSDLLAGHRFKSRDFH